MFHLYIDFGLNLGENFGKFFGDYFFGGSGRLRKSLLGI
jgi:hypothetical protein